MTPYDLDGGPLEVGGDDDGAHMTTTTPPEARDWGVTCAEASEGAQRLARMLHDAAPSVRDFRSPTQPTPPSPREGA